jgi:amidase
VPLHGVVPFAPSYDTIGWFAHEIATLAAVGDVLLPNATPAPIRKLVLVRDAFELTDVAVAATLHDACATIGVDDEIDVFDGRADDWRECYRVLQGVEIWRELGPWIISAKPCFGADIAPRFADAASITEADVAQWSPARAAFASHLRTVLTDGVGLLIPTAPSIALRKNASGAEIGAFYQRGLTLTSIAGHAGLPQITLPVGEVDGCPVGLSIIAQAGDDRALLDGARSWALPFTTKTLT